ncbi:hypothetical protein PR202_gb29157 [Eleusine coracana subsp. coracana]|uniref:DUF659 domain-containing protein n=1 Tax=Eleusine coracana subsp. coracana TaxID=191504 RepID=A0AAV5FZ52_ELECO|nr:hypothetical protein PR202_gb29157 [Eleusine coracana subsp. coracana]
MQDHKHLDALIARAFYSGGVPFNFARNPYLREAFNFAATRSMPGYQMPRYNKFTEGMLAQERSHIGRLLDSTKSTWQEKGVTICADGWTDPQRRPLINFVDVCGNAGVFFRADNCERQVKTKEYIAEKLKSIIEEVGRQNVVQIITDNTANYKVQQLSSFANEFTCLCRYYSKEWLDGGASRLPPHKDREVSKMRMTCFKKFFHIPEELAQVKEEYAKFSNCSELQGVSFGDVEAENVASEDTGVNEEES